MEEKVWVARTKLTCYRCGKLILPGHRYVWEQIKRGTIAHLERSHPECKEEDNAIT